MGSRAAESVAVWNAANRRLLSLGVGMAQVSRNEHHIRETAARGVVIHIVMVDPQWVLGSVTAAAIFDDFYDRERIGEDFRQAHSRLTEITRSVNREFGPGRMRMHTYRSVVAQSATIADPGSSRAFGLLELHTYGRYSDRIRTVLPGPSGRSRLLAQKLRSVSNLAGYDFTRETPDAVPLNSPLSLA